MIVTLTRGESHLGSETEIIHWDRMAGVKEKNGGRVERVVIVKERGMKKSALPGDQYFGNRR